MRKLPTCCTPGLPTCSSILVLNPRRSPRLPCSLSQASLSISILWTSGQFSSRVCSAVLCSAVLRIAKRHEAISLVARWIFSHIHAQHIASVDLDYQLPIPPSLLRPKKARLGLSSVDLRWTVDNLPLVLDGHPNLPHPAHSCHYSFDNRPPFTHSSTQLTLVNRHHAALTASTHSSFAAVTFVRRHIINNNKPSTALVVLKIHSLIHSRENPPPLIVVEEERACDYDCRPRLSEKPPIVYSFTRYSSTASRHGQAHFHRRTTIPGNIHIDSISVLALI